MAEVTSVMELALIKPETCSIDVQTSYESNSVYVQTTCLAGVESVECQTVDSDDEEGEI